MAATEPAAVNEASAVASEEAPTRPEREPPAGANAEGRALPLYGYYASSMLTRMPEGIGVFDIQPPAGGDTGAGGKMTLRIWISAAGAIDALRVMESSLPPDYEYAALAAFRKMRFKPGEIGGVPVQSVVDIVIEYADFSSEARH